MKKLITTLLCIAMFPVLGQSIESDNIDEFNKSRVIKTKAYEGNLWKKKDFIDDKNEFLVSMMFSKSKDGTEIYAVKLEVLTARDFGCFSEHAGKVMILFENDSTMELAQFSETDCGAPFTALYVPAARENLNSPLIQDIVKENFNKLASTNIKKIRVYATKGFVDITLKPEKTNIIAVHAGLIRDKLK